MISKLSAAAVLAGSLLVAWSPSAPAQSLTITTFAGPAETPGAIDGIGSAARFSSPYALACDSSGNLYVADTNNHTIRKVSPTGGVTTLAGLAGNSGTADETGDRARFSSPGGVAVDSAGNVYVADTGNHTIRKITPAGLVTTLAGLAGSSGASDGSGSLARFNGPYGVATDSGGNLYVGDTGNHTIRKITPAGVVTTVAGLSGTRGSTDGTGSVALFDTPRGVTIDSSGNIYVADDYNDTIRKIAPGNVVTTFAGLAGTLGSANGTGSAARFTGPVGVGADSSGNVYVAERSNSDIRKISPAGVVTTLAGAWDNKGSADGSGSAAQFWLPCGVAVDGGANVYVADTSNHVIRKVTPAGAVTTLAGLPYYPGFADGERATATFNRPQAMTLDSSGNLYLADTYHGTIRKITPAGVVSTYAGYPGYSGSSDGTGWHAQFYVPMGVAADSSGNVYVADAGNHTIRKIAPGGVVTTFAGLTGTFGSADGTGSAARFYKPKRVATDGSGNIFVVDSLNCLIRKVTPAAVVTTITNICGDGIAADISGNVYAVNSNMIKKITPAGVITTLAGSYTSGSADGIGAAAQFRSIDGLAVDGSGDLYVADYFNYAIRKVTAAGVVTTLAGGSYGSANGTGTAAQFAYPMAVAFDSASGNLYIADTLDSNEGSIGQNNNTIRLGRPSIDEVATIDASPGLPGVVRQLGTSSQLATSWEWDVIRRPADSVALLSSPTVRSPTFTPDKTGLFILRLLAVGPAGARISTVELMSSSLAGTTTAVTSSANPSGWNSSVTFTATVTPAAATGSVTFKDGAATLGTRTLSGGTATYTTTSLTNGSHAISVIYDGDANYLWSASATLTQTVNTDPLPTPTNVIATAQTATSVLVTWTAVPGATSYQVYRRASTTFSLAGTVTGTSYTQTTSSATSYLYRVRALNTLRTSADSAADIATTVIFTNPVLNGTPVKALHLTELRNAVNACEDSPG